jgi:hypothetical protein
MMLCHCYQNFWSHFEQSCAKVYHLIVPKMHQP